MNKITFFFRYLQYLIFADSHHGLHSPFVYELYEKCILNDVGASDFVVIENIRKKLLCDKNIITVTDYGTGKGGKIKVCNDVRNISKSHKYASLLYRIVKYFEPATIVELGAAMGISTLYFALANRQTKIITVEACPQRANIAVKNFETLAIKNIELLISDFDEAIPSVINKIQTPVIICVDGNHAKEATLRYFQNFIPSMTDNSLMIFDDIHWSRGMEAAWNSIKQHSSVTITIDLFFVGLVFFKKGLTKQDFILRF